MKPKIQEIYKQNVIPDKQNLHVNIGYNVKLKIWTHVGWICDTCGQTLKTQYVAKKHICQKTILKRISRDDMKNAKVYTTDGRPWKSIVLDN